MLQKAKASLRNKLVRVFQARGYELVPSWEMAELPLVRHLQRIFRHYEIDCVLDVGGNKGQYAKLLRTKVGYTGHIVTFEPVSTYLDALRASCLHDPKWDVIDCALGSAPGEAQINVTRSPGLNSFLAPRSDQVDQFWQEGDVIRSETVRIQTLDNVAREIGLDCRKRSVYLKLDTQGFDLQVLAGAASSLQYIRALQTEASVRAIYHGMPSYRETLDALSQAGFDLSGMYPVTLGTDLRLVEFDCLAVNSRFSAPGQPLREGLGG